MAPRSRLLRACYGGTETMRAMVEEFLPQYDRETDDRYDVRLASTFALNKLREAVDAASAKPFRSLVKVENGDPDLRTWIEDVDLQGNHLHVFAHRFFNEAMLIGQAHILADHPSTKHYPNLKAQRQSGARPFLKLIRDEDLVAAYTEYVGGDAQVVHARIRDSRVVRDLDFKEVRYNQIWVIEKEPGTEQGVVQLWEQEASAGSGGQWSLVGEERITLSEVPLATLHAGDKEGDFVTRPVFLDLAYKQVEHWISSSDQRSILSAARFPMLACSGVQLDPEDEAGFAIGPFKVLYAPDANGRWYFVEPKGTAIDSGLKDLQNLEMHMDMMALNPVQATHRQYVAKNERDIQETRVHSVVHDLAIGCQDAVERALRFMGNWSGKDYGSVRVLLNTGFSNTVDKVQELGMLLNAVKVGAISRKTFLQEAQNRSLLGEEFSLDEELKALEDVKLAATSIQESVNRTEDREADFPDKAERPTRQI